MDPNNYKIIYNTPALSFIPSANIEHPLCARHYPNGAVSTADKYHEAYTLAEEINNKQVNSMSDAEEYRQEIQGKGLGVLEGNHNFRSSSQEWTEMYNVAQRRKVSSTKG